MTTWAGAEIAGFARDAGFRGDSLVMAVAVALEASGGDDHARTALPIAGLADWRGLWLVRTSLVAPAPPDSLYEPRAAARAVRALTGANGGDWGWSEVYEAGGWRRQLDEARDVVAGRAPTGSRSAAGQNAASMFPSAILRDVYARIAIGRNSIYHLP